MCININTFSFLIFKDLQPVEMETHIDMLYANIIDITTLASQPRNQMVSIRGRIRKVK